MRQHLARLALLVSVAACGPMIYTGPGTVGTPTPPAITTGDQVVNAMQRRYDGRWYRTMTFVQKSTYYRMDGSLLRTETWYEAAKLPGRLRIDLGEPSRGNGVLYRSDSTYQLQSGRVTARRQARNILMLIGFDVYTQPAYRTREQLLGEGIDLRVFRVDTLDGRRVYVVGAAKGDSTTNQLWIEAERLLFLRGIMTETVNQQRRTRDIRFERYTQYEGGWVAEEVRVLSGGIMTFHEEYSQVRVNVSLEDDFFLPERWSTATHWYRQ